MFTCSVLDVFSLHMYSIYNACLPYPEPSAAPRDLVVQNISANELSVEWERPPEIDINGVLILYYIEYFIAGEPDTLMNETVLTDALRAVLNNLNNYTVYNVSVSAGTASGRGPAISMLERTSENGMYNSE